MIVPGDFTEDNGLLTPSMKVKRDEVLRRYASTVDGLYRDARGPQAGGGRRKRGARRGGRS